MGSAFNSPIYAVHTESQCGRGFNVASARTSVTSTGLKIDSVICLCKWGFMVAVRCKFGQFLDQFGSLSGRIGGIKSQDFSQLSNIYKTVDSKKQQIVTF